MYPVYVVAHSKEKVATNMRAHTHTLGTRQHVVALNQQKKMQVLKRNVTSCFLGNNLLLTQNSKRRSTTSYFSVSRYLLIIRSIIHSKEDNTHNEESLRMPISRTNSTSSTSVSATYEGIALPPGPSLAHLPDAVVYQFLRIARSVICSKFVPILWVRGARRRRERQRVRRPIAIEHMGCARACEVALTESSEFVQSANASSELPYFLAKKGQHVTYQPGDIIFHHGEPNSSGVHVLVTGRVNLFSTVHREKDSTRYFGFHNVAPPPSIASARGTKKFSTPVAASSSPSPFGTMQDLIDASLDGIDDDNEAGVSPGRRGIPSEATSAAVLDFRGDRHPQHLRFAQLKSKGLTNTHFVRSVAAPFVFGDMAILNDEPRLFFCVAESVVDVVVVPRSAFFAALQGLPTINGPVRVLSVAHAVRAANMPIAFPLTLARLRLSPLFIRFTDEELQLLLVCAQPKVFAQGAIILERSRPCQNVYIVRRGLVEEVKERGHHASGNQQRTSVALWEGATFGEREAHFKERSDAQYIASTNVDLYQIPMDEIVRMCSRSELLKSRVVEAAKQLRVYDPHEEVLQAAKAAADAAVVAHISDQQPHHLASTSEYLAMSSKHKRYVDLMRAIPFWNAVGLPRDLLEALAPHWVSQLYSKGECLFYKSDMCDKMVIIMRGNAKLLDAPQTSSFGNGMTTGECVGYTCLLEHRWQYSAMATEVTEAISLPREKLMETIKLWDAGLLRQPSHAGGSSDAAGIVTAMDASLLLQGAHTAAHSGDGVALSVQSFVPSSSKKTTSIYYQKLLHATTQLLQPLFRRAAATAFTFPALDAATRRAPSPNSFDQLTIVNLHPISREEHVRLYPPYSLPVTPSSGVRDGIGIPQPSDAKEKKQFLTDFQKFQAKQQTMRRGLGSSGSLQLESGGPQGGRRRSTAAAAASTPVESTPLPHHRLPSVSSPTQQHPHFASSDHGLPKFQLPERPPSRTTKPPENTVKVDIVGNIVAAQSMPPDVRVATAAQQPTSPVLKPPYDDDQSFNQSTITSRAAAENVATTLAVSPARSEHGTTSGGGGQAAAATTSEGLQAHLDRLDGPSASHSAVEDIFKPLRSHRRSNVAPDAPTQSDDVLPAPTSPNTAVSRTVSDVAAAGSENHSAQPTPQVRPPPQPPRLLQRSHRTSNVTPRAKKTLTYSASENFGSLMQSMVQRCQSPRGQPLHHDNNGGDPPPTTVPPSATAIVCTSKSSQGRYMWHSTSVATPLLPSRPASAILDARCSAALREQHHLELRASRSPRCTAYNSQRSYIRSLVDASRGPSSPTPRK
jgi:CRP-like cAMP-binding protein